MIFGVEAINTVAILGTAFANSKTIAIELKASGFLAIAAELLAFLRQFIFIVPDPSGVFFRNRLIIRKLISLIHGTLKVSASG